MAFDPTLLASMGVHVAPGPIRIPLYAQKLMVDDDVQPIPGMIVSHVIDVDPEVQALIALALQIVDGRSFRRYMKLNLRKTELIGLNSL